MTNLDRKLSSMVRLSFEQLDGGSTISVFLLYRPAVVGDGYSYQVEFRSAKTNTTYLACGATLEEASDRIKEQMIQHEMRHPHRRVRKRTSSQH